MALALRFAADLRHELRVLHGAAAVGAEIVHPRPRTLVRGQLELRRAAARAFRGDASDPEFHKPRVNKEAAGREEVLPGPELANVEAIQCLRGGGKESV